MAKNKRCLKKPDNETSDPKWIFNLNQSVCKRSVWWWYCHRFFVNNIYCPHINWNSSLICILTKPSKGSLQERRPSLCAFTTKCPNTLMKNWLSVGNGHSPQTKYNNIILKSGWYVHSFYKSTSKGTDGKWHLNANSMVQWRNSGAEILQLSRKYLSECSEKMLIHFNQFFGLSNDLAPINNEKWELKCSFAISQFISKYNLA